MTSHFPIIIPAETMHIPAIVALNNSWHKPNLTDTSHGYLSVMYSESVFESIVKNGDCLVFVKDDTVVGYVLVNTVQATSHINNIQRQYLAAKPASKQQQVAYSYQILLDKVWHGTGFFYEVQKQYSQYFKGKYDVLVSTISKQNKRSIGAHKKASWNFIDTDKDYFITELNFKCTT